MHWPTGCCPHFVFRMAIILETENVRVGRRACSISIMTIICTVCSVTLWKGPKIWRMFAIWLKTEEETALLSPRLVLWGASGKQEEVPGTLKPSGNIFIHVLTCSSLEGVGFIFSGLQSSAFSSAVQTKNTILFFNRFTLSRSNNCYPVTKLFKIKHR